MNILIITNEVVNLQYYFWARVCQSVVHWLSISEPAILVRFGFFIVQLVSVGLMYYKTFNHLMLKK